MLHRPIQACAILLDVADLSVSQMSGCVSPDLSLSFRTSQTNIRIITAEACTGSRCAAAEQSWQGDRLGLWRGQAAGALHPLTRLHLCTYTGKAFCQMHEKSIGSTQALSQDHVPELHPL